MKTIISLALLALPLSLQAQKSPVKFGVIPPENLTMTQYGKDTSAAAVILVDYGKAFIEERTESAVLTFERHVRVKILKKEGLSSADVSILLRHSGSSEEKVNGLKASTFNLENGQMIESKLAKEGIFKERFNRSYNQQKFSMPNVKVGSVLDYTYTVTSDFFTTFPNWRFQKDIPIQLSEYWAIFPEIFFYEKYVQGYVPAFSYEVKPGVTAGIASKAHHWIYKDVPAFKEEPFMTCEDDYVSKVNFELSTIDVPGKPLQEIMGSWEKLSELLMDDEDFGRVIAKSGFLKGTVDEVTTGISDPLQKVIAIHSYVKETIQWDGEKDFYAGNLKKIIEQKKGTSGDINLILASMLDKAGFNVDMVMLSTRDHGFIRRQYPISRQFNYVICAVRIDDKILLLDATEKYLPYSVLPERCLNGQGLIISKVNKGWIDINSKTKAKTVISGDFTLDDKGELKGKLGYTRDGYDAGEMRNKYYTKGEEVYVKDFLATKSWGVQKTEFADLKDLSKSTKEIHDVVIAEHATAAGDVIYINPIVTAQIDQNPFKLEQRTYPVDFGTLVERQYICKIGLPDGYQVDELPQSKAIALPGNGGRYVYNVVQTGNLISLAINLQINKSLFTQAEYPTLREFYNQVVAKQAEQVVIKKK